MHKFYQDNHVKIEIIDGIIISTLSEGCVVNKDISYTLIEERLKISQGKEHKVILDASKAKYWTMSSRNKYMKENSYKLISAAAIVLPSTVLKTVWYYTVKLFPPPVPIGVYTRLEDAVEYLKKL